MENINYKNLFEKSPAKILIADTDLKIISITDAYLEAIDINKTTLIGTSVIDLFTNTAVNISADSLIELLTSIKWVIAHKQQHTIKKITHYPNLNTGADSLNIKHWKLSHSPIMDELNEVKYIVQLMEPYHEITKTIDANEITNNVTSKKKKAPI